MKAGTLEEFGTLKAMAPLHVLILARSRNDAEVILHERAHEPRLPCTLCRRWREGLAAVRKRKAGTGLDIIMPKLGGPAVASRLTTLFPGLPILFTSGYSQDSETFRPPRPTPTTCKNHTALRHSAAWCVKFLTR